MLLYLLLIVSWTSQSTSGLEVHMKYQFGDAHVNQKNFNSQPVGKDFRFIGVETYTTSVEITVQQMTHFVPASVISTEKELYVEKTLLVLGVTSMKTVVNYGFSFDMIMNFTSSKEATAAHAGHKNCSFKYDQASVSGYRLYPESTNSKFATEFKNYYTGSTDYIPITEITVEQQITITTTTNYFLVAIGLENVTVTTPAPAATQRTTPTTTKATPATTTTIATPTTTTTKATPTTTTTKATPATTTTKATPATTTTKATPATTTTKATPATTTAKATPATTTTKATPATTTTKATPATTTTKTTTTTTKTTTITRPPYPPPNVTKCVLETKADILLLLDASSSIGAEFWEFQLRMAVNFTKYFDVAPDKVRFSVVTFAKLPTLQFDFKKYTDPKLLQQAIRRIKYNLVYGTRTDLALKFISDEELFSPESGGRENEPDIIICMTDGISEDYEATKLEASNLKEQGIFILAVGIGNKISEDDLEEIANSKDYVVKAVDYNLLDYSMQALVNRTCSCAGQKH